MTWWDAAFLAAAGVAGGLTGSIAGLASIATYRRCSWWGFHL
jgi:hypothetical protein